MSDAMIYSKAGAMVYQGECFGKTLRVTIEKSKPVRVVKVFADGSTQRMLNRHWQEIVKTIKKQIEI